MVLRCLLIGLVSSSFVGAEETDYAREVLPILSNHCFKCHGPDVQKSGLRLDRPDGAFGRPDSGRIAIVAGNSQASELLRRVTSEDSHERMPLEGAPLEDSAVDTLRRWIDAGATYTDHWADIRPSRPGLLSIQQQEWPLHGLDHFVLSRLEDRGLSPAPEADRVTLIRRVSLDLTGLPPSIEEVDVFLADERPDAYARVVDRLLASPHFGERWARWWLDLARYGDTNGYEDDQPRPIWLYRDWVIATLNRNEPFDRFSVRQIAGDLVETPSQDDLLATGFHRNSLINTENGSALDEWKDYANKDRVNTLFTVWMGATFECAQCHNHKFDPITQEEYYGVYAFFNSTTDLAGKRNDDVWLTDTMDVFFGDKERLDRLETSLNAMHAKFEARARAADLDQAFDSWRELSRAGARNGNFGWEVETPLHASARDGTTLETLDDQSILSSGHLPDREAYTVRFRSALESVTALRLEAIIHESFTKKSLSRGNTGNFILTDINIEVRHKEDSSSREIKLSGAMADYSQKLHAIALAIDENPETGWSVDGDTKIEDRHAVFLFSEPVPGGAGTEYTVRLDFDSPEKKRTAIGRFRLSLTRHDGAPNLTAGPPPEVIDSLLGNQSESSADVERRYFNSQTPLLAKERKGIEDTESELGGFRKKFTSMVMITHEGEYRPTHVQNRGDFLDLGTEVQPDVPACFGLPLPDSPGGRPTRTELAEWLVHPDNPRTARVTVNRIWDVIFGRGIVTTSEDFGVQGALPSHPKLLDWLATEFVKQKWDFKGLIRAIVSSALYRQSSAANVEKRRLDPDNALFSRGARYRVEAEMLRDIQLAASGALTHRIGGSSAFPPQPVAIWEALFVANGYKSWPESKDSDRYRRGLYTYVKRTALHPVMRNFDATNRTSCVVRRSRSNTPLAALTALNEKSSMEAAGGLACRMLDLPDQGGPPARIVHGFRLCVSRSPRDGEREALLKLYARVLETYTMDSQAATRLVESVFQVKPKRSWNNAELAAWIVVANTLLNMDATLSRG